MTAFARALAAFRVRQPAAVQAETDALAERLQRIQGRQQADFSAAFGRMHADGSLPDRRRRPRSSTATATSTEAAP